MTDDTHTTETYRAECSDCSWSYENRAYGTVESKALAHSEHAKHSVPQPDQVRSPNTDTEQRGGGE